MESETLALLFVMQGILIIFTGLFATRMSGGDAMKVFGLQALVIALMIPLMVFLLGG